MIRYTKCLEAAETAMAAGGDADAVVLAILEALQAASADDFPRLYQQLSEVLAERAAMTVEA